MCMNISQVFQAVRISAEAVSCVSNFAIIAFRRCSFDSMRFWVISRLVEPIFATVFRFCGIAIGVVALLGVFVDVILRVLVRNWVVGGMEMIRFGLLTFNFFIYSKDGKFPARIELLAKFVRNFC